MSGEGIRIKGNINPVITFKGISLRLCCNMLKTVMREKYGQD